MPALPLEEIRTGLGECTRCKLHSTRTKIVFGSGNPQANIMFIGEAPGADEDSSGLPFVGRAGKKLTQFIQEDLGLTRDDVYICNIVKCRPPNNRPPEKDEVDACSPFLKLQIRSVNPKVIVTLGASSTNTLLGGGLKMSLVRGVWQEYKRIPVMPTFHPSYIIRGMNPTAAGQVSSDLKLVKEKADI